MNGDTPSDSEERSGFNPAQSISTLADLQVKAYENRVRERLLARLEKGIDKLVQIYAQGRNFLQGVPSDGTNRNHKPEEISVTRGSGIIHERE
jgi:hypothetical protein